MSAIKNVAVAGASGALGSFVFKKLVESGKFNIRVIKRAGSSSTFPAGTDVVEVDYSSFDSLKAALQGQDAIISTLTTLAIDAQITLIDAAIAAGITRFIPSEFGSNLDVPSVRALPVFAHKVQIQDYLIEKSKSTQVTYTFVYNAAFLDWGLEKNFLINLASPNPILVDGGDNEFSTTTLPSVADALVGILNHPEETKNRVVYIHDTITTQKKLLALAQKVAPEKKWEPVQVKLDDLTAKADERLAKGLIDLETFTPYLFRAIWDPKSKGKFDKTDNELLGVKGVTDEDIIEILKPLLK
ncbi:Fc.00g096410.m01.CDS01 [Cosmosporella sp. VM-42]